MCQRCRPLLSMTVAQKIYANQGNGSVLRQVPDAAIRVLDVGCGMGDNARFLVGRGHVVDGITLSQTEATAARSFCRRVLVGNLEHGLPSGVDAAYDCCLCSHVIEHICWPERMLADIHRTLLPTGGALIVALPNLLNYKSRLRLLTGDFEYTPSGLMDDTHFRWYTFKSAQAMLRKNGFRIELAFGEGGAPLWPVRRILPRKITRAIDKLADRLSPGLFGNQLIFVARPVVITSC